MNISKHDIGYNYQMTSIIYFSRRITFILIHLINNQKVNTNIHNIYHFLYAIPKSYSLNFETSKGKFYFLNLYLVS